MVVVDADVSVEVAATGDEARASAAATIEATDWASIEAGGSEV